MKEKALYYFREGYNCSQCILKAAEIHYKIPISKQCMAMCSGVNTGFGIGEMCSVLIAAVMVFGLLFDEKTVKSMRIRLLTEFNEKYGENHCCKLKAGPGNCSHIVGDVADMMERIIGKP